jgi:hypothetical protein
MYKDFLLPRLQVRFFPRGDGISQRITIQTSAENKWFGTAIVVVLKRKAKDACKIIFAGIQN